MPRHVGLVSGHLVAVFLVLCPAVSGADDSKQQRPSEVVLKSLDTNLLVDGRAIETKGEFLRYRVEQEKGDWLWLVADAGTRGWCQRRDVIAGRPGDRVLERGHRARSPIGASLSHARIGVL